MGENHVRSDVEAFLEDLECDCCGGECMKVAENVYECTECGDIITIEDGHVCYEIGHSLDNGYDPYDEFCTE